MLISWRVDFRSIPRDCVTLTRKQVAATAFRPLLNKVKAGTETGNVADEVYRPSWFAFETMTKFLDGVYRPRSTMNTKVRWIVTH
jgi:hypothetical protein